MKKIISAISLLIVCGSSVAYDGWSTGKILEVRIQSERILIRQMNASNPGECPETNYIHLSQGETAYHKNMFATLLTAYAANKEVSLAISGCNGGYPAVSQVWSK